GLAAGLNVTLLERGADVQTRRHGLAAANRGLTIDPDSNYCFGEGGAGTYSDGKLYARAGSRSAVRGVLEVLVAHGAPSEILASWRPHVGSNRLPRVVRALRETLERSGGAVRFRMRAGTIETDVRDGGRPVARGGGAPTRPRRVRARAVRRAGPGDGPQRTRRRGDGRAGGCTPGSEGVRHGAAHRASAALARRAPVRRPARRLRAAGVVLRARDAGRGTGRVQLLHVSGRLRGTGQHGVVPRGGERHEPVTSGLAVRQPRARRAAPGRGLGRGARPGGGGRGARGGAGPGPPGRRPPVRHPPPARARASRVGGRRWREPGAEPAGRPVRRGRGPHRAAVGYELPARPRGLRSG